MRLISVDMQNDFASSGGSHYGGQPCTEFVTHTALPFLHTHGLPVAEIVSDYRTTGGSPEDETCAPGQWGYESTSPSDMRRAEPWVKASISPTWVRDGGGDASAVPGHPRSDPTGFTNWLRTAIGPPDSETPVVLVGLLLEVCVLASLIEIKLRGHPVAVLVEGVDAADGDQQRKRELLDTLTGFWGAPISWSQFTARAATQLGG